MTHTKLNALSDSDLQFVCGGNQLACADGSLGCRDHGSVGDYGVIEDLAPNREELETHVG